MAARVLLTLWACSSIAHAFLAPVGPGLLSARTTRTARAVRGVAAPRRTLRAAAGMGARMEVEYGSLTVTEAAEEGSATMIWLHGMGDQGREWQRLSQSVAVPWVKFICPTAPRAPSTINKGFELNQWFDIGGLEVKVRALHLLNRRV